MVDSFKYLGVDIVLRGGQRPAAGKRRTMHATRCQLVRCLPRCQRGAATVDCNSQLWLSAGSHYSVDAYKTWVRDSAEALCGRATGFARASRAIIHLIGPALHMTHPAAAAIYCCVKQVVRMRMRRILTVDDWNNMWQARSSNKCGLPCQFLSALRFLGAEWADPFIISFGGNSVDFHVDDASCTDVALQRPTATLSTVRLAPLWHCLRDFLRFTVSAHEAARRPRDYKGLEAGWCRKDDLRQLQYELWLIQAGRSFATGCVYTADLKERAFSSDPSCPRCGAAREYLEHRLFHCTANSALRVRLEGVGITSDVYLALPNCLRRCGIILDNTDLTTEQLSTFLDCMTIANADAAQALAYSLRGNGYAPNLVQNKQPLSSFRGDGLPPFKRR